MMFWQIVILSKYSFILFQDNCSHFCGMWLYVSHLDSIIYRKHISIYFCEIYKDIWLQAKEKFQYIDCQLTIDR